MMNKVIAIGNVGKDVNFVDGATKIANFSVATNFKYKDKTTTEWIRCVAFGRLAEICHDFLSSGKRVYIEGRLQTREWTDSSGNKKYSTEVVLADMKMLSPKEDSSASPASGIAAGVPAEAEIPEEDIPY